MENQDHTILTKDGKPLGVGPGTIEIEGIEFDTINRTVIRRDIERLVTEINRVNSETQTKLDHMVEKLNSIFYDINSRLKTLEEGNK